MPAMQKDIHPQYFPKAKATCVCGATYEVGSTAETIKVEICRACHPFFSGQDKVLDSAGRVERFKARLDSAKQARRAKATSTPKTKKVKSSPTTKAS